MRTSHVAERCAHGSLSREAAHLLLAAPADDVPEGLAGERDRAAESAVAVMAVGAEVSVAAAGGPARHAAHDLERPRAGDSRGRDERDLVVAVGIAGAR